MLPSPLTIQFLKKNPKVYLIRPPSASLPTAAIAALQNYQMACQLEVDEQSNPGRTEQPLRYTQPPI